MIGYRININKSIKKLINLMMRLNLKIIDDNELNKKNPQLYKLNLTFIFNRTDERIIVKITSYIDSN